jgi:hypothetical protein
MGSEESQSSELNGNHLDGGSDDGLAQCREHLCEAALRKLRDDPDLQKQTPALERYLRGLINKGKIKAPATLNDRALDGEIADAVRRAIDDFRHKRHLRSERAGEGTDGARVETADESHEAGAAGRPDPFPDTCIRGTCEEWIKTLEPRGEWPLAFLFEEWRMIHSMSIARSAGYGRGKLRYPHCHDLLVGESGITHKNTSINRAGAIIQHMRPEVLILGNVSSIEGVLEALKDKEQSVALIAAEEYSYLVATSQRKGTSNIIPILNDAYDGKDPLTITRKSAPRIKKPFVNLVAGCTPAWIVEYADKEGSDLGRFNRITVFYADQDRNIFDPEYLRRDEEERFAELFKGNLAKASTPSGEIAMDAEAHEWLKQWFLKCRLTLRGLRDNLRKLMERDDDQARIQALIYAVADGRQVISLDDVTAAAALIEWSRKNKMRLLGEVEFNADQRLERRILAWIERGAGTMIELYRYLGRDGTREAVHRKLKVLAIEGSVTLSRPLDQPSREPLRLYPPEK